MGPASAICNPQGSGGTDAFEPGQTKGGRFSAQGRARGARDARAHGERHRNTAGAIAATPRLFPLAGKARNGQLELGSSANLAPHINRATQESRKSRRYRQAQSGAKALASLGRASLVEVLKDAW